MPEQEVELFLTGAARFRLAGELVYFDVPTDNEPLRGAMSADHFIETFGRAAETAHQWASRDRCEVIQFPAIRQVA